VLVKIWFRRQWFGYSGRPGYVEWRLAIWSPRRLRRLRQ
jgi:hypothetical protein